MQIHSVDRSERHGTERHNRERRGSYKGCIHGREGDGGCKGYNGRHGNIYQRGTHGRSACCCMAALLVLLVQLRRQALLGPEGLWADLLDESEQLRGLLCRLEEARYSNLPPLLLASSSIALHLQPCLEEATLHLDDVDEAGLAVAAQAPAGARCSTSPVLSDEVSSSRTWAAMPDGMATRRSRELSSFLQRVIFVSELSSFST